MTEAAWSEEEIALLRRLLGEGLTAASIAGQLGTGRTAKAVRRQVERLRERPTQRGAGRCCSVCGAWVESEWWADFRRCPAHRNRRAA